MTLAPGYGIQIEGEQAWEGEVVEMMNSVWHMVSLEDTGAGVILVETDLRGRQSSWLHLELSSSRWVVKAKGRELGQAAG